MPTAPRRASRSRLLIAVVSFETAFNGIPQAAADSWFPAFEIMEPRAPESARELKRPMAPRGARKAGRAPGKATGARAVSADALDQEPNENAATATPLAGTNVVVRANIFPGDDLDFYSFSATAGDRVYAAVQTLFDAQINTGGDTVLDLLDTDGATVIESDNNDGTFDVNSSSLAGVLIPSTGTFFLRVRHNLAGFTLRPYDLHFNRLSGAPVPEVEPNNTLAGANPVPASGWVSGTITAVSPGESDLFSIALGAGDSVYLSLDLNPERDANVWNGRLGFGLFGNPPADEVLTADDANAGASAADPNSEAFFFTVLTAGIYYLNVDSAGAAGLGANATYNLSVAVHPAPVAPGTCTTYTSTNVPVTIPTGPGSITSTLTIPGHPRIDDLDVSLNLNHAAMQDLDVHLISPAGNDNGLFTDIGAGGAQTLLDLRVDDEAALPLAFPVTAGMVVQPEAFYRLSWFDGEDAGGTWTLQVRDDLSPSGGGTLNSWSVTVCEPPPPVSCAAGFVPETVFTTDFESGDAGFTHSGFLDEWERGLPSFDTITTCNSGTNCWKTDLDNSYEPTNIQDLLSPGIDLAGLAAPVVVSWAQRYQLETAGPTAAYVDHQQIGGATPVRLFEWLDAGMIDFVGNPQVTIGASSGWSALSARADSLAGQNTELRFHLAIDNGRRMAGWAIDDVSVTACRPVTADLAITKTDGVTTAVPGGSVTYTVTASNPGLAPVVGGTVADTFPAALTCTWTCTGALGGTCTAAGAGNVNDTVNIPVGGSVTYTAACTIAPSATGSLVNTATVSSSLNDPNPANNSATDTDTLSPEADLKVTKTDGQTTAQAGEPITYTIVASNAGPSSSPGATVTDAVPAALTGAAWTCTGAGGGACTAAGSGSINDVVDLPAGGSVTYTLTATIVDLASGSLANTATVAAPSGVLDPNPGDNSATDTDTVAVAGGDFFYSIDPCRILDTRGGAPIGGPAMAGEETRTLAVAGTCGVPVTAKAIVVNVTVTQSTAGGYVTLFAAGQPTPAVSNINYSPAQTRANSAVVTLSAGALDAFVGQPAGTSVHVILDVSGYFE